MAGAEIICHSCSCDNRVKEGLDDISSQIQNKPKIFDFHLLPFVNTEDSCFSNLESKQLSQLPFSYANNTKCSTSQICN